MENDESIEWLGSLNEVPFYSIDSATGATWHSFKQEGSEHTGNESRPEDEDSIYLTHAMVVLPINRAATQGSTPGANTDASPGSQ